MERTTLNTLTKCQRKRAERNRKLLKEYSELIVKPGQSRIEVMEYLKAKYGFETIHGVYRVIREKGGRQ